MSNFFPSEDYKLPVSSNYMRFQEGENTFRVLSSAIVGYEYWNTQNKPVRVREALEEIPENIKTEKDGSFRVNHFWAFVVWNYEAKKIQILELTQKGIMKVMTAYIKNPKWGSPMDYDFIVSRAGSGLDTEYATSVNPKSPLEAEITEKYEKMNINLDALYEGKDPFGKE